MTYLSMQGSIIKNKEVLSESFVPEQVLHRMDQLKIMAQGVEPILSRKSSKTVLMYGSSGSGKTTSARHFLNVLGEQDHKVRTAYVSCWKNYTKFHFLKAICEELQLNTNLGNVSSIDLCNKIERVCMDSPCLIVVDEFDRLEEKDELYNLREFGVSLILITSDHRNLFRLKSRIESRLGVLEKVHFPPYKWQELADIIESRGELALMPQVLSKAQIRRIALCSQGNAHLAVESLKLAAERAEDSNCSRILDEHVEFAVGSAKSVYSTRSVSRLNEHQKVLLEIIKEKGEIKAGELQRTYKERMKTPASERTLRNYLHKLEKFGFIRMKGMGRWRVYGVK